jgi:hypothetical protein
VRLPLLFALLAGLAVLPAPHAAAQGAACPAAARGEPWGFRNDTFGFAFSYPPLFRLDPESVTERGDSARFWTSDRRATAVVNAVPNTRGVPLRRLMAEAEGDITHNSGGEITYRRIRDNWFVLSGHMAGRIFYRRTLLTSRGIEATLWMEFPRDMRPCLDEAVTVMSLSFRER